MHPWYIQRRRAGGAMAFQSTKTFHRQHKLPQISNIVKLLRVKGAMLQSEIVNVLLGETITGSWWSHPNARHAYNFLETLAEHKDIYRGRLIEGKVTFIHRRLWKYLIAVGLSKEAWQLRALTVDTTNLLCEIEQNNAVISQGKDAKSLAERLLVAISEIHTETGKHALLLEAWQEWARRRDCDWAKSLTSPEAKTILRQTIPKGKLPWE